jgi:putative flippase GtrA
LSLIRDYYLRFQVLVHEVAKFGVVGAAGFVVQLGVQNALHSGLKVGAITSLTIAYILATVVTFLGNRHWAFRHRKGAGLKRETLLFVLLNVVGYGIQVGIVDLAYYELGYKSGLAYNLATVIGIGLATLWRLFAYRTFVFNNHQPTTPGDDADELYPASMK